MGSQNTTYNMDIGKLDPLKKVEEGKIAADDDSEDEGESIPKVVENYYFTDENQEPVSLSVLPIQMDGDEINDTFKKQVFLEGTADGGLQKVYKQAIAFKLNLQDQKPVVSVLIKDRVWIELQKPRKSYEEMIQSFLITVHFLHFARQNPEASEKAYWDHLSKIFSAFDVNPVESDLLEHYSLIEGSFQRDQKLKDVEVLKKFVETKSKKRKQSDEEMDINSKAKKTKFLVSDGESDDDLGEDGLDESDEDEEDLFDSVCAICDNGGELLCCEGSCMRSFHPNREAGEESSCKSLGLSKTQIKEMQNFYCLNCKYKQHQCFYCGKLGSSDKSSQAEVFCCVSATCGRFYHPQCVSKLIAPEAEAAALEKKIAEGLQFTCPLHRCHICSQTEKKEDEALQFAICRRCPRAYHRKCLPKSITFEETDDEPQRAWEDLIPNRILIYCRKHKIDPDLGTPRRNHIIFPEVPSTEKVIKKKYVPPESSTGKTVGTKSIKSSELSKEKAPAGFTKERVPPKLSIKKEKSLSSPLETASPKFRGSPDLFKKVGKDTQVPSSIRKEDKQSMVELKKSLGQQGSKLKSLELNKSKTVKGLTSPKQNQKKPDIVLSAFTDNEIKTTIMNIVGRTNTGISLDEVYSKHQVPSSHSNYLRNLDKSITQGKVEGSVEAVRTALKKLEEGGSIDDAKAVCGPDILKQMAKWKNKLKVYLAPFLHGMRYTSFGRHFTKIDKLQEVVERLHWYVLPGDTIVDFCCGANDFSRLMKAKLEQTGKQCYFKNFDIIQPKYDFEFEKRDWLTVCKEDLVVRKEDLDSKEDSTTTATGTRLIMGLNPPFGVKAALANIFIKKALEFLPKLLILIVPRETKRLDGNQPGYDLIWEDLHLLKGESFYMPGSVDVDNNQLGQWNTVAPPLYLWSRPDFTIKHMKIAIKHGHVKNHTNTAEADVSDARPSKVEVNASQLVEGNTSSGKNVEKDRQGSPVGNETINKSAVDNRDDESKKKYASLSKTKEENKESGYERHLADMKNRVENYDQRGSEVQNIVKDSDMHDEDHDHRVLNSEQNPMRRQDRGPRDNDSARQKHQKEKSPVKEKHNKGKRDKGRQSVDKFEKERADRERHDRDKKRDCPDKSMFEKERINLSPPLKRLDFRRDFEDQYEGQMQEQSSLYVNATDGFGRTFDRGHGNREDHVKGLQIGSNEMGHDIGRSLQGILPGHAEESYATGYHRRSGVADDGLGRAHRGSSEEYGRVQLGHSGSAHDEYSPAEMNRNFPRKFSGLESEYSVSPPELQMLQNNRQFNRQVPHEYDSERTRLFQDNRASDWLMSDSQRNYIDQVSHGNNLYVRNPDLGPETHRSSMLAQQHEEPLHHRLRGPHPSESYERSVLTSSAMQRYAPRLDHNMNYSRQPLNHVEQTPGNNFLGAGQVRGSQNFSLSSLGFGPASQNHPPHSSSGWIDE